MAGRRYSKSFPPWAIMSCTATSEKGDGQLVGQFPRAEKPSLVFRATRLARISDRAGYEQFIAVGQRSGALARISDRCPAALDRLRDPRRSTIRPLPTSRLTSKSITNPAPQRNRAPRLSVGGRGHIPRPVSRQRGTHPQLRAALVVDNVVYLVAGGGGAKPYYVERTPDDLNQSVLFPNFHYVKITLEKDRLRGDMYRLSNPEAPNFEKELKDTFEIPFKPR